MHAVTAADMLVPKTACSCEDDTIIFLLLKGALAWLGVTCAVSLG